jgi:DNA-binding transcriptional regulator GbsR (MarR family)
VAVFVDDVNTSVEIDSEELSQRVAILKRFKKLLTQQRDRFHNYLDMLEKQQSVIESGSAEDLLNYVEIEEKIVSDIYSIQKVIDPLEEMYNTVVSRARAGKKKTQSDEVPSLKESLEKLQSEAVIRSTKNKELLSKRMLELRAEIKSLRNNPYAARRTGLNNASTPSLVDLKG